MTPKEKVINRKLRQAVIALLEEFDTEGTPEWLMPEAVLMGVKALKADKKYWKDTRKRK